MKDLSSVEFSCDNGI